MSDAPKRSASERNNAASPTVIPEGAQVHGDVRAPGAVMLSGTVRGDGDVGGRLSIAKGASWEGMVKAREAVIAGSVIGGLVVEGKLEAGPQAVIRGHVSAKVLAIADGAVVEGDITITSDASIVPLEAEPEQTPAA
ncbi:MAG: polymer-forming cytoskeletal protein [Nevskiaceae bacterium]|jgi:cytoskeletal protein CcmA (bactofilin family)|nr:polymer-forming cytoskeletal protein [Nevskiaceae bacterium]